VVGTYERGNEPSGSIICGAFLDKLRKCWLLKKDSGPCSLLVSAICGEES
jgi:hypothetical protein